MKLCSLCQSVLLDSEIEVCSSGLCFYCCEQDHHIGETPCAKTNCSYIDCSILKKEKIDED